MSGLFQLAKRSWELFSLTFQKWNLPQAGGHQRLSGGSQNPLNPNLCSWPSTKKEKTNNKTNRSEEMRYVIFLNKDLTVLVERTAAPNKHFLQFPIPTDEIFTGSDTGCWIKTKVSISHHQLMKIRGMWSKPSILYQVTNMNHPLPLQSNIGEHIQLLLRGMR